MLGVNEYTQRLQTGQQHGFLKFRACDNLLEDKDRKIIYEKIEEDI